MFPVEQGAAGRNRQHDCTGVMYLAKEVKNNLVVDALAMVTW